MVSDLAGFLVLNFMDSLESVRSSSQPSDPTLAMFKEIGEYLNPVVSSNPTTPELIQVLSELNDVISQWQIHKEQKTAINNIFSFFDNAAQSTDERFTSRIRRLKFRVFWLLPDSPRKSQPKFDLDRFTFYESGPSHAAVAFHEYEIRKIVGCLSRASSGDQGFKAVGIYGIGGSGKTALVKHVLKHQEVVKKFNDNIIWVCLSHLTSSDEVDIRIVKYMLNYLNYDVDDHDDEHDHENEAGLINILKRHLLELGNYVIVLDDMWHCSKWITGFFSTLAKDNTAAALIVTSREEEVVQDLVFGKKMKDKNDSIVIHIDPWDYMNNGNFLKDIVRQNNNLVKDGDEEVIVRHCHGLALAANELPQLKLKYCDESRGENGAGLKNKEGGNDQ